MCHQAERWKESLPRVPSSAPRGRLAAQNEPLQDDKKYPTMKVEPDTEGQVIEAMYRIYESDPAQFPQLQKRGSMCDHVWVDRSIHMRISPILASCFGVTICKWHKDTISVESTARRAGDNLST